MAELRDVSFQRFFKKLKTNSFSSYIAEFIIFFNDKKMKYKVSLPGVIKLWTTEENSLNIVMDVEYSYGGILNTTNYIRIDPLYRLSGNSKQHTLDANNRKR